MAIIITNISPDPRSEGWHTYEVRINRKVVCTFEHLREQGLSACLERAARAVYEAELKKLTEKKK